MSDEGVRDEEYAQGNLTQDEIVQKHGINISTLRNWLYRSAKTNNGETIDIKVKEDGTKREICTIKNTFLKVLYIPRIY